MSADDLIKGTVLHYHSAPSPFPRRMDPVEAAHHFDEHGFKAVVLKSHHHNTVMDVLTIQKSVLDKLHVKVFASAHRASRRRRGQWLSDCDDEADAGSCQLCLRR